MDARELRSFARILPSLREAALEPVLAGPIRGRHIVCKVMPAGDDSHPALDTWLHPADVPEGEVAPVVFELHGGGFAMGDARKTDALCEWIRDAFNVHVVGVNYRLAPEHPWPAALDDVLDVLQWYAEHAAEYRMDTHRFILMGYSAGAQLALVGAIESKAVAEYHVSGLALHYPFFDASTAPADKALREIDLPIDLMEAFNDWYCGDADRRNPRISPIYSSDAELADLPVSSILPVEGDAMADEGVRMADRLRSIGVDARLHMVTHAYHGYIEDAVNPEAYRAANPPETIQARPQGTDRLAGEMVFEALSDVLDAFPQSVPFPWLSDEAQLPDSVESSDFKPREARS
ncbi:esterase/lipase [Bifidobacterium margollesii]|uniref:Esterase/lipase n=1 Tax=Bifidobacterium margollesii TaxID=2020964 RepID=A0A2N5JC41_9BIFI|nr:alpha/beta hydrolase [Bifidobacterium margollesii]PLS31759.1 esterase/lipase [Bifidobacterium margollesii]